MEKRKYLNMVNETEINELLETYLSFYEKIKPVFDNLSEEKLEFVPAPGKWSIKQIANHLCDSEIMAVTRMQRIIAEETPQLLAYDQNNWANKLFYEKLDPKISILIFGLIRQRTYLLLKLLPASAWERKGKHSERGDVSLLDMLKTYVKHGENHLQQIHNILAVVTK